jgi:hypothetical protein
LAAGRLERHSLPRHDVDHAKRLDGAERERQLRELFIEGRPRRQLDRADDGFDVGLGQGQGSVRDRERHEHRLVAPEQREILGELLAGVRRLTPDGERHLGVADGDAPNGTNRRALRGVALREALRRRKARGELGIRFRGCFRDRDRRARRCVLETGPCAGEAGRRSQGDGRARDRDALLPTREPGER